jgi:rSAM/selenodomain-associated transferase 1
MAPGTKKCVAIFVKYPQKGEVKTRLAAFIGHAEALNLYKKMAVRAVSQALKSKADVFIFFHPPGKKKSMISWLGNNCMYLPQRGKDLGAKMKNCFKDVFNAGYDKAVIVGSDIPRLNADIINKSFIKLKNSRAVIGPAKDGGYYLIGFPKNSFFPLIFDNMKWSTDTVFKYTMKVFKKNKIKPAILPVLQDIDTPEGLKQLPCVNL